MVWYNPTTWFSSSPLDETRTTTSAPAPLGSYPASTTATGPYNAGRRRRRTRRGRKGSRRGRSGRKSNRS